MGNFPVKIKIKNNTHSTLSSIELTDFDSSNFPSDFNPISIFKTSSIKPKHSGETNIFKIALKDNTRYIPIGFRFNFSDHSCDYFKLNLYWITGEFYVDKNLQHIERSHEIDLYKAKKDDVYILKIRVEDLFKDSVNKEEDLFARGLEKMKLGDIGGAIEDLSEARRCVTDNQDLADKIEDELSSAYEIQGDNFANEGYLKEKRDEYDKDGIRIEFFKIAQNHYEKALFYSKKNAESLKMKIEQIKIKIDGDNDFQEALYLNEYFIGKIKENKAIDEIEMTNLYDKIIEKYKAAKSSYEKGLQLDYEKFKRGLNRADKNLRSIERLAKRLKNLKIDDESTEQYRAEVKPTIIASSVKDNKESSKKLIKFNKIDDETNDDDDSIISEDNKKFDSSDEDFSDDEDLKNEEDNQENEENERKKYYENVAKTLLLSNDDSSNYEDSDEEEYSDEELSDEDRKDDDRNI